MARGSGRDVQRSHRAPVAVVTADLGLFILRVVVGAFVLAHGLLKLGWAGKRGSISGVAGWFQPMRLRPGRFSALVASLAEAGGRLLMVRGLGRPLRHR